MEVSLAGTGAELDGETGGGCLSRFSGDLRNNVIFRRVTLCLGGASDGPYQCTYAQDNSKGDPRLLWNLRQKGNNE